MARTEILNTNLQQTEEDFIYLKEKIENTPKLKELFYSLDLADRSLYTYWIASNYDMNVLKYKFKYRNSFIITRRLNIIKSKIINKAKELKIGYDILL